MTANPKPLSIVAKCALCSTKTELFVCPHCDEVICQICVNKHQSELNETLKEHWLKCKIKFQNLTQLSSLTKILFWTLRFFYYDFVFLLNIDTYEKDFGSIENEILRTRQLIEQQYSDVIQLIDQEKNILLIKIQDYIQSITSK